MDSIAARAVAARIRANRAEIQNSLRAAAVGNPFAAELDHERRKARLQAKAFLTPREAAAVSEQIEQTDRRPAQELNSEALARAATHGPPMYEAPSPAAAEKVWDAPDFVSVSFLAKGARIARAVGRVAFENGRPQGSGFLIGERLFITNHHVVPTPEFARNLRLEFDYELDLTGNQKPITRFALDTSVWITDDDRRNGLDYTIFAVGDRTGGGASARTVRLERTVGRERQAHARRVRQHRAAPRRSHEGSRATREPPRRPGGRCSALRRRHGAWLFRIAGIQQRVAPDRTPPLGQPVAGRFRRGW